MLTRVYIDNYRCLSNFTLRLGRLNLLLGKNGAGKSTAVEVLACLRGLVGGPTRVADFFPDTSRTRWSQQPEQTFEIAVQRNEREYLYRLVVDHADRRGPRVASETLTLDGQPLFSFVNGQVTLYRDDHSQGPVFRHDWSLSGLASVVPHSDNASLTWFKEYLWRLIILGPLDDVGALHIPRSGAARVLGDHRVPGAAPVFGFGLVFPIRAAGLPGPIGHIGYERRFW